MIRSPLRPSLVLCLSLGAVLAQPDAARAEDDLSRTLMVSANDGLRAQGMDYVLQQIDYFGPDGAQKGSTRYFQQEFRWAPGDARRGSTGPGLTYLVDESWPQNTTSTVAARTLEQAVNRAAATWREDSCLEGHPLRERPYPGDDVTVADFLLGTGGFGDPFAADIVVAGLPSSMQEMFGDGILAFAVTFVFVDASGVPTDVDGDGHLDTALSEIYLNPEIDWSTSGSGGYDLETALLHETGHALGLGHFGSPPQSVMTPVYSGVRRTLYPIDHAALCVIRDRAD